MYLSQYFKRFNYDVQLSCLVQCPLFLVLGGMDINEKTGLEVNLLSITVSPFFFKLRCGCRS